MQSQPRVQELHHPVVAHHLTMLRDSSTPPDRFRHLVRVLSGFLAAEATADLLAADHTVTTPIGPTLGRRLSQRVVISPILRAGHGMADALLELLPDAEVRHLGVYRDEQTLQPVEYYHKLPTGHASEVGIVIDPMLATGGSAVWALAALRDWGVKRLKLLSLIAAPQGIARVTSAFADVQVYVCRVDQGLNEHGYIVPGLGDAGDRYFNTL